MPKTSNLRSEVNDISKTGDRSFVITVTVWEIPGTSRSEGAVRFQFQTNRNPSLWWRLSMTSARAITGDGQSPARYTNALYNKAARTANDAMNAFIMRESDVAAATARGGSKKALSKNPDHSGLTPLTYGTMPTEVDFLMQVSERFESPFAYYMSLNSRDSSVVERAADTGLVDLVHRNGMTTIVSPRDMYQLIDSLRFLGDEMGNERANDIASALLESAGFEWV